MCLHKNLVKAFGIVCVSFLFCAINAYARDEISAWAGVSTIELKGVKGMFDDSLGSTKLCSPTCIAPTLGLEYMHGICNNYKIGTRLGASGKNINLKPRKEDFPTIEDDDTYCRIIIMPIMFGGSYSKDVSKNFSLNGKSFLGYAFVDFKSKNSFTNKEDPSKKIVKYLNKTTGCLILDFSIGAEWLFTKRFGIGFDVGYRFTPEVIPSKDIKLDFSGVLFALNLSYKV